ncbi:hypothetical protein [Natrinema caseinilyticum]|uniref:hypothetical protein n=1 Tax=Natrinema caseinilyticum TaxID=2961570 RepID=UPI0020C37545|nr:hypothetical protein [Natrinema caseinilyticum]
MPNVHSREQFPSGYGLVTGVWFGLAIGILAFLVSAQVPIGMVAFVATGAAIGVGLERVLETRSPTSRERRFAIFLGIVGVVAGGIVFFVLFN